MDKGFVFVSTNYRLLPSVDMGDHRPRRRQVHPLGARPHRRVRRRPEAAVRHGPLRRGAARRADLHRRPLPEGRGAVAGHHQGLRAGGRRHLRRAGHHRDGGDPVAGARPAAGEVRAPREVRQRPGEAPRLLRRHARGEGQGHPAVPDPARRRASRHDRAGAAAGQRAEGRRRSRHGLRRPGRPPTTRSTRTSACPTIRPRRRCSSSSTTH